jgi:hypothetical protein
MQKMDKIFFPVFIILLFSFACAPTAKTTRCDVSPQSEKVYTFSIPPESTSREIRDNKPDILKGFPFISSQPVTNFRGKFPPEFYSDIKYRWNAEYIGFVDFWKLRYNQHLYDVIYIDPMWIGDLSLGENDFLKNIIYSYNISDEQFKILETWIRNGGILWMEPAIFISSYDYNLNKFDDEKLKNLVDRLKTMTILGNKLNVQTFTAKKIDEFNMEKLSIEVTPEKIQDMDGLDKDVKKLLLEQSDYIGIYITVDGPPIIKSGNTVYASYVDYGSGKIITLAPFDFRNVHYDGEIFRLDLLSWALNGRK